jgi:hypothetical protein
MVDNAYYANDDGTITRCIETDGAGYLRGDRSAAESVITLSEAVSRSSWCRKLLIQQLRSKGFAVDEKTLEVTKI